MMERYISFIVRHRLAVVLAVIGVTVLLGTQLRHVHMEIRRRANLPDQHPYVQVQNRISDLFGGEAIVIIGVVANQGTIFTPEILGKIQRITDGLRDTAGVIETSLFSIAAPYVKAVVPTADNSLDIHPLMDGVPHTAEAIRALREAIHADPVLRENLIAADDSAAVIVAEFDDTVTDAQLMPAVHAVVDAERGAEVTIALAGAPVLRGALSHYTAMIAVLFPLAVVVIGLIHYEAFRTLQAMFLPLVTALLSVIWAVGIMGLLGAPMDTWSAMTPVLILAVAAGHAVQILKRYYEEFARVGDSQRAVIRSVTAVGPVMLTAGLIAAAGFGSLATFGITSVRTFGLLLASGILSALVIEMTFTPACRCLLPAPKIAETKREGEARWLDRALEWLADLVVSRPRTVLAAGAVIAAIAAVGALTVRVDNSFRYWFAASTQVRQDDALLNQKLPGSATLRLLIDGHEDGVLKDPKVLEAMSDLEAFMDREPNLGGVSSIADYVKRLHQAMHGGDAAYYRIPDNRKLIEEYLFLYSMSAGPDGLSAFVDAPFQHAVVRALSKTDSAVYSRDLLDRLSAFAAERFAGLPVTVGIAGGTLGVQTAMNDVVVHEKVVNIVQVSAIILVLCALVLRSLVGAAFVLVPLAMAVLINLGLMGWTGTWLDMTTAAISAMGVSIGADFAIYLIFRIREEWGRTPALEDAIRTSLTTSGKAIFFVSSGVTFGYLVLPFSGFSIWVRLGVLTSVIVSASALGALTMIPALALVFRPRFLARLRGPATAVSAERCVA